MAEEAVPGCTIGMTENGWNSQEQGLGWLEHFERYTRRTEQWQALNEEDDDDLDSNGYRLLIMDGHINHINLEFVQFREDYRIIPICLPPHTTHLLQPLDLVIFSLLKRAYSQKVDEYIALGITGLNREWFLKIIGEIRSEIYTANHINSAFEAAGLYPYNPERALSRCKKSDPVRALTPTDESALLLSSPLHPRTPISANDRARYLRTITNPKTSPEAVESCVQKLVERL